MNKRDRIVDGIVLVVVILVVGLLFYLQQRPTPVEEESKPEGQAQVAESCPPLSGYSLEIAALGVYVAHNAQKEELFRIHDEQIVEQIAKGLNEGKITEELKDALDDEGITLPDEALVLQLKEDEWQITSNKQVVIIREEYGRLGIYFREEISLDEAREFAQDLSCAAQDAALEVGDALVSYSNALVGAETNEEGVVPDEIARDVAEGAVGKITPDALITLAGELGVGGAVIDAEAVRDSLVDYMINNEQTIKEAVEAAKDD